MWLVFGSSFDKVINGQSFGKAFVLVFGDVGMSIHEGAIPSSNQTWQ
jgi:hypothetical protein